MPDAAVRTRPLDDFEARALLAEIEAHLARPGRACFGIAADATIDELCEAYATLADRCHPRHFATVASVTQHRATRCYRALREAFWQLAGEDDDDHRITNRFRRVR